MATSAAMRARGPGGDIGGEGGGIVLGKSREVGGHRRHHHRIALELGGVDVLEVVAVEWIDWSGQLVRLVPGTLTGAGLKAW